MKRLLLTALFTFYHIFMPFVLMNCSAEDLPYVMVPDAAAGVSTLEECQSQEYLTEDCVAIIQAAEEEEAANAEAITAAYDELPDFIACQAGSTDVTETSDCEAVVADVLAGNVACLSTAEEDRSYTCDEIEGDVADVEEKCAAGDTTVSTEFCAFLV